MQDQSKRTWDGSGFDEGREGFLQSEDDHRPPKRVIVPPPGATPPRATPPVQPSPRRNTAFRIALISVLGLVVVLGGIVVWRTFFDLAPNQSSQAVPTEQDTQETPTRVDTGVVVRNEIAAVSESGNERTVTQPSAPKTDVSSNQRRSSVVDNDQPSASAPMPRSQTSREIPESVKEVPPSPPSGAVQTDHVAERAMPITPAPKGDPIYVVQVCATPDLDDAHEWVKILRNRRIDDASITEYRRRSTTWYRVRFGSFANRQDAERAAMKVGVTQPWIARLQ